MKNDALTICCSLEGLKIKMERHTLLGLGIIHATNLDNRSRRLAVFVRKTLRETHRQNYERLTSTILVYLRFSSARKKCSHRSLIPTEDYRIGLFASFMLRTPQWQSLWKTIWFSMNQVSLFPTHYNFKTKNVVLCLICLSALLYVLFFSDFMNILSISINN